MDQLSDNHRRQLEELSASLLRLVNRRNPVRQVLLVIHLKWVEAHSEDLHS